MKQRPMATVEVLVVDDEPDRKEWMKVILQNAGILVSWAVDWFETEAFLTNRIDQEQPLPDVLLVDMYFVPGGHPPLGSNPGMEGLLIISKVVKLIKSTGMNPPPLIGYTGSQKYMEAAAIIKYGATDFITESEFNRPNHFARRLLSCVMEASAERPGKLPKMEDLRQIEDQLVIKAMKLTHNNVKESANLLNWPENEIMKISNRVQEHL